MSSADSSDEETTAGEDVSADDVTAEAGSEQSTAAQRRAQRRERGDRRGDEMTIPVRAVKIGAGVVVALIVAAVIAVGSWQLWEKNERLSAFDDSKAAAGEFLETYMQSMMAPKATPKSLRAAVGPLTTGDLKARLDNDAVVSTEFMKENRIENATIEVTASMVESFDDDRATVVVGADISGTSAASPDGGKQAVLLQIELEKSDGDWLVSDIGAGPGITVGARQGAPDAPAPGQEPAPNPEPQPGG
ncbi:hypothetical protein [Gordonia shandongensis]|uniref:hypothetical protein n=1 Tax=Gordonia shandongensis TaxID=376351 RepID=UPI00041910A5|nr:hypothetical protein [Gordonia shandongensis]